ncbi:MAG: DEAD/DEAH box helicase [Candidatus Woesearchaeota archaeon]
MEFSQLNIIEPLLRALKHEGYTIPTPIQVQAIPPLLEGKDLMGIAQTGTGKTAAFLLPILQHLSEKKTASPKSSPRVLILAPTRELAAQIGDSCKTYGKYLHISQTVIFGGVGQNPQVGALRRGIDVLVATPGRLLDLMQQGHVYLDHVEVLVLDEADRMLDMGFINDVKKIVSYTPKERQTLCFSATMSREVEQLARTLLHNPAHVAVTPQATTVESVEQKVFFVDQNDKDTVLIELLKQEHLERVLIFTRTKFRANKVANKLCDLGIKADAIHGNKSQNQRTQALAGFQKGRTRVLVATDIAARGIDVEGISHVINYDLPNEAEGYVHRIGRTARAGAEGTAYSFCASDERGYLHDIERLIQQHIEVIDHQHHSEAAKNATGAASRTAHTQRGRGSQRSPVRRGAPRGQSSGRAGPRRSPAKPRFRRR